MPIIIKMKRLAAFSALTLVATAAQAFPVKALTPYTLEGNRSVLILDSTPAVTYVAPQAGADVKLLCNQIGMALSDGNVVLLDFSESFASKDTAIKSQERALKDCAVGADIVGNAFFVKLAKNSKKVLATDWKLINTTANLLNKLNNWK